MLKFVQKNSPNKPSAEFELFLSWNGRHGIELLDFCLLLWKHLLILKILPVTLFKKLVPDFQIDIYDSKSCSEIRPWFWKLFWNVLSIGEYLPLTKKAGIEILMGLLE